MNFAGKISFLKHITSTIDLQKGYYGYYYYYAMQTMVGGISS